MTNPAIYQTKLLKKERLNSINEEKGVYHLIFDIAKHNLDFSPGDCLAVLAENSDETVEKTILALNQKKDILIQDPKSLKKISLFDFLKKKANITRLQSSFILFLKEKSKNPIFLQTKEEEIISKYALWDFLLAFPQKEVPLQEFCNNLPFLYPRYYSIASSKKALPNSLEIIVVNVNYTLGNIERKGVSSHYLCDIINVNSSIIHFFIHKTLHFHLPNPSQSIIMIGAGTGIAPFRSFLQERVTIHASGKNWLFFGEKKEKDNFYFKDFLLDLVRKKSLTLDLAFSRDQIEKVYVQHRLLEKEDELISWIDNKSIIYICGDAKKMARDVELTLEKILEKKKGITNLEAKSYIRKMKVEKLLRKDVY